MTMLEMQVRGKKAAEKLILTMEPDSFPRLEITARGVTHYRTVGWHQLLKLLDQSMVLQQLKRPQSHRVRVPELPEHTLFVDTEETSDDLVVIVTGWVPRLEYPFVYEVESFLVPVPTMVYRMTWSSTQKEVSQFRLAVAAVETVSRGTQLYRWPFSNVHASGQVCWSANRFPCELSEVVQKGVFGFLQTPNNRDLYGLGTSHNAPYRDYQEFMKTVHEHGYVPPEWLIPQGVTVREFHSQN